MTQVFANNDQLVDQGLVARVGQIPAQPSGSTRASAVARPESPAPAPGALSLGPAITPGKGVRRIRCVGCAHETLPRTDDGAPLCPRCSELLAAAGDGPGTISVLSVPVLFRAPRWLRRRSPLPDSR